MSGLLVAALCWGSQPSAYRLNSLRLYIAIGPAIGIWNYTVGDANYQVAFSRYEANEIN